MKHLKLFEQFVNEAKDNLYLQLHKKYADQIKGLKAKKIKKLTDLVSVQRWAMEDEHDTPGHDHKKMSAVFNNERKLFKQYLAGDHSVMLPESINEGSGIPSNIEKFAKEKGVLADIKQIARWAKKAGLGIRGGTAIGKGYDTLVLDLTYQGAEIYYDTYKGTIKVKGKPVDSWKTFSKAVNESVNEDFTKKDWDVKWKMPKDNLFNATKTKNAVENRYKALQNLLKDKPKELKAFDATDDHPAYDMSYDELMKWYNNLSESVNEAQLDRFIVLKWHKGEKSWEGEDNLQPPADFKLLSQARKYALNKYSQDKNSAWAVYDSEKDHNVLQAGDKEQNFKRY